MENLFEVELNLKPSMNNTSYSWKILDILRENTACARREIIDRLYYDYGTRRLSPSEIGAITKKLHEKGKVKFIKIPFPDRVPFQYAFRPDCSSEDDALDIAKKKDEAFTQYHQHSRYIGKFLEKVVKNIFSSWDYKKIDVRKKSDEGISIDPEEIDVYCHDKSEPNLIIQVKNRKADFNFSNLQKLQVHQWKAITNWKKSSTCAIVTSFIDDQSKKNARNCGIPWIETKLVFIPSKVWRDYKRYRELCRSNYYVLYDKKIHRQYLKDKIYQDIIKHKYLISIGRYPLENISFDKDSSNKGFIYPKSKEILTNREEEEFYESAIFLNFITSKNKKYDEDMIKLLKPLRSRIKNSRRKTDNI